MTVDYAQLAEQFTQEQQRLLTVCGHVTAGGVLDQIVHVGATSIPGLAVTSGMALAVTAWPFPLAATTVATLAELGYVQQPANENCAYSSFYHTSGAFQLYIWTAGADAWFDLVFTCDYLRHAETARRRYADAALVPVPAPALVAEAHAWRVRHHGFAPLHAVADELRTLPAPWYISSGWALDLFLGQTTRSHYDVDVVVARDDQMLLQQHLAERGWQFATYLDGRLDPWPLHMRLELPRHQVHAHRPVANGPWAFIDFLLTELAQGVWRYRREPSILQALERVILQSADGIPFLAPEVVLLFKSKNTGNKARPKDQIDFDKVYPHLDPVRKAWLRWALLVTEPHHPWLELLA